jgi:hypothetical protein
MPEAAFDERKYCPSRTPRIPPRRTPMPAFRRVDAQRAGAMSLGILVPPGGKTLVIMRPRGLEWDLLPARWGGDAAQPPVFCQFDRDEAALVARRLPQCLEEAVLVGKNPVETFGKSGGQEFQVWVRTGDYVWIVCRRLPGASYVPLLFASHEEARNAARRINPFFHPAADADQEYYFNTQNFSR